MRHALKGHEGKYQCNTLHSSYHMLYVSDYPESATKKPLYKTKISYDYHPMSSSTESIYNKGVASIPDMTANSLDELEKSVFAHNWEGNYNANHTQNTTVLVPVQTTTTHHRSHHHHHNNQQQQQQQKPASNSEELSRIIYINVTKFDGQPHGYIPNVNRKMNKASNKDNHYERVNPTLATAAVTPYKDYADAWRTTAGFNANTGGRLQQQQYGPPYIPPPRLFAITEQPVLEEEENNNLNTQVIHYEMDPNQQQSQHHYVYENTAQTTAGNQQQQQHTSLLPPLQTLNNNHHHAHQHHSTAPMQIAATTTALNPHLQQQQHHIRNQQQQFQHSAGMTTISKPISETSHPMVYTSTLSSSSSLPAVFHTPNNMEEQHTVMANEITTTPSNSKGELTLF